MNKKECSCEWCDRTEENWNGRFKRIDGIWYCDKHYQQLKNNGRLTDKENERHISNYKECCCDNCIRNTNNYNGKFIFYNNKCYCSKHYTQMKNNGYITDLTPNKYGAINDMPRGWTKTNELNNRIYEKWWAMFVRCYDENFQKKRPTYKDCYVCERWFLLSNFVEDVSKITNYEYWVQNPNKYICLDKDIKSNGNNKCYCLEECIFIDNDNNIRQANKTRDYSNIKGKNNYNYNKGVMVAQYDLDGNLIKIWDCAKRITETFNWNYFTFMSHLSNKKYSNKYKGFIWKYYDGSDNK